MVLFDPALKVCGEGQTDGIVQSVSLSEKKVCVLLRDRMVAFDQKGTLLGGLDVDSDSILVASTNTRAYVVGISTLAQYDIAHFAAAKNSPA